MQEWHSTLPLSIDSRPAGHATHASPPKFVPSPSSASFARSVTKEPTGHVLHCAAPSAPLKVPIGHERHCSSLTAPDFVRYVPMGHELHSPMSHEKQLSIGSQVPYMPGPQPDWQSDAVPKSNTVPASSAIPGSAAMCESKRRSCEIDEKAAWP